VAMLAEHGVAVSHTTILRCVLHYVPEFEKRWNRYARRVNSSWRVDETAVPVRGGRHYLYRAVDKRGKTVDSLLCKSGAGTPRGPSLGRRWPRIGSGRARSRSTATARVTWRYGCSVKRTRGGRASRSGAGAISTTSSSRIIARSNVVARRRWVSILQLCSDHVDRHRTGASYSQTAILVRSRASASDLVAQSGVGPSLGMSSCASLGIPPARPPLHQNSKC
jgi:hypothetical protein